MQLLELQIVVYNVILSKRSAPKDPYSLVNSTKENGFFDSAALRSE